MESKDLTVVIVTFKSDRKILSCLNSISKDIKVLVVENSDSQSFKNQIEEKFSNVKCILTGSNNGYAVANNIGLKEVKTKFSLVLNPDTILQSDTIKNFFDVTKKFPNFWLIGPYNNQSIKKEIDEEVINVKNLKGFAIFINMEKFQDNFFDENFFLYFEEIDLCKKVKDNNGDIFLAKSIRIQHDSASSVNSGKFELEKNRNWHWMWSSFYFHKKHKGFFIALLIVIPKLISCFIKIILYSILSDKEKKDIYCFRMSGLVNSIIGKKSWYRPSID